jgi:hypothetical protein
MVINRVGRKGGKDSAKITFHILGEMAFGEGLGCVEKGNVIPLRCAIFVS